jgi:hypothetical protein
MACNTVSDALRLQATSQCTENGVVSAGDSPLIVVLLLHGGDETDQSGSDALLQSLSTIGPAILPPRISKISPPFPIRCIPSSPPVCVAYASSTNAALAAACVLPDIAIFLPSSSSVEASPSPEALSAMVKLRSAVPTVPVVHALNAPAEAVGVCGLLAGSDGVDWMQFAAAASAAVRSIRYGLLCHILKPMLFILSETMSRCTQHEASCLCISVFSRALGRVYMQRCCSCRWAVDVVPLARCACQCRFHRHCAQRCSSNVFVI